MSDPIEQRLYLSRRLGEARVIRDDAGAIVVALERALSNPGLWRPMNDLRFAEWVAQCRKQLEHIHIELLLFAFEPSPPVWLVIEAPRGLPWWRGLWPW